VGEYIIEYDVEATGVPRCVIIDKLPPCKECSVLNVIKDVIAVPRNSSLRPIGSRLAKKYDTRELK
jgi:hypothetical protein